MKLDDNLIAFASETSIHGLNYIAKTSSSKAIRLTWFLLFMGALVYALAQISDEVQCKHLIISCLKCKLSKVIILEIQKLPQLSNL